jgi:hypothetical protein
MANASTLGKMSPELLRVVERAKREPEGADRKFKLRFPWVR